MGATLTLDATPVRDKGMHEIMELHVARVAPIKDRAACRNRLDTARDRIAISQLKARIFGGSSSLRTMLFMPAVIATRYNRPLRKTCLERTGAGKPWKVAIAAIMRKLMVLANALIRDDRKRAEITPRSERVAVSRRRQQARAASCKARAERLIREGRMHRAGMAAPKDGKASGLWHASAPVDALEDPEDLVTSLEQAGGLAWWQGAAPSCRPTSCAYSLRPGVSRQAPGGST